MGRYDFWWVYLIIAFICAVCSAFCSGADLVYGVVDRDKLAVDAKKGDKRAAGALKIANDYELSISTILFGNNVVNVIASSMLTLVALSWIHYAKKDFGQSLILEAAFTVLLIIFCEFLPKAIAKRFNYQLAKRFVIPVTILKYSPTIIFVWPISKLFKLIGRLFKKKSKEEDEIDEDVLTEMVDTMEEEDKLEENEAELVRSAIDLNDIQAYEIMTPRVDVFAINVEDDIEEILEEGEIFSHSRIPVYEETIDNIIGILPLKALLRARLQDETIDLKTIIYTPLYVPRNHQVLDLLNEFKESKVHIAVIVDEYGGTEGIITMEDILEEIVGDIFDETDEIKEEIIQKDENTWIVDGSMNIDDFFETIGFDEEFETDYTTVGGLCQEILDRFAKDGDEFDFSHYHFRIIEADDFTVEKLEVKNLSPKEGEE
ncbi:MAG: hemolysin family protein [Bacilli bacterium]|nr:hemolysin family protein [Bacilli bacterium]